MNLTLVSTVVAPCFEDGVIVIKKISADQLPDLLRQVTANYIGHMATDAVLRALEPSLPQPVRAFWDGTTQALAARPKGGVRGAQSTGDTQVTLSDLEFVLFSYIPGTEATMKFPISWREHE